MATYATWDEAKAAYLANADYRSANDITKARTFRDACQALTFFTTKSQTHGGRGAGEVIEDDPAKYERDMQRAEEWLRAKGTEVGGGSVHTYSFRDFRR